MLPFLDIYRNWGRIYWLIHSWYTERSPDCLSVRSQNWERSFEQIHRKSTWRQNDKKKFLRVYSFQAFCVRNKCGVPVAQSCPILCFPMDSRLPGSSGLGILPGVGCLFPFCRGSSWPGDQTQVSYIAGGLLSVWAKGEPCRLQSSVVYKVILEHNQTTHLCITWGYFLTATAVE